MNRLRIQHILYEATQNMFHNAEPISLPDFQRNNCSAYRTNTRDASSYWYVRPFPFAVPRPLVLLPFLLVDTFFFAAEISSLFVNSLAIFLFLPRLQVIVLIIETGLRFSRSAHDEVEFPLSIKRPEPGEADIDGFEQRSAL
jgi:hypothetical protein